MSENQRTMNDEQIAVYCQQLRDENASTGRKNFVAGFALGAMFALVLMVVL